MINGIPKLAKWLRVDPMTVYRNLKHRWQDMPREVSKRGKLNSYKFNKDDVFEYLKKKFN